MQHIISVLLKKRSTTGRLEMQKKRAFEGLKFVIFLGMFTGLHWVQIQFKITITLHSCNLIKSKVRVIVIDQTQSACNCNCSCN